MSQSLIRHFFLQMLQAERALINLRISHLDLKVEQFVIGDDLTLKLIDYGQASHIDEIHNTPKGTKNFYMAPEVWNTENNTSV